MLHTRRIETADVPETTPRAGTGSIKTFLIADVRGYTAFTNSRGDEAAAELAMRFASIAREAVEDADGSLIELRGDEALAVFDSARQAIRAAIDLQRRFVESTVAEPTIPLGVGIGLDAGEAVAVEGGFRGGALNLAARLCSLAGPAEVLASREVSHLARKVEGIRYVERGAVRLKGLDNAVEVVVVRPELDDPSQELAFRRALGPALPTGDGSLALRNPYKGLRAFEESDAGDFFGRDRLVDELVERLRDTRFLAVVGPSGSGKSSVVRAGLVPALRAGALPGSDRWQVIEMFPGAYPLEELEAALLRVAKNPPASLLEQLESDDDRGLIRAVNRILPADGRELLLVIDQLEEVFTLVPDEERRMRFLAVVERAATESQGRLRVVTTLRADFYDRPLLYSGFAELLRDYVEALVPLSPDEFEQVIIGPAKRADVSLEPGLLAEMVADITKEPGALPLLQYALTELYERREGPVLTRRAYREIGGVSGALAGRAEEIFSVLGEAAQDAARQLFLRLVTLGEGVEDTRRRVERSELASTDVDADALTEAIDGFGDSRLLSFDRDPRTGAATIEVAHEALIREWTRLRRWIDGAREDLRMQRRLDAATREWEDSERDPSFLLRGGHLAQFAGWAEGSRVALTDSAREFVAASEQESNREVLRERRQNRRLKLLLVGVAAFLLLAVVAGVVALAQRQSAKHEATVALARELGSDSVIEPRIDRAMLLAREGVSLHRSAQTEGALLSTLLRSPAAVATFPFPLGARPLNDAVSPDGKTLVVADNQTELRFFDTGTHRESRPPLERVGAFGVAAYSADGSKLLSAPEDAPARLELLDPKTFEPVRVLPLDERFQTSPTGASSAAIAPDAKSVAFAYALQRPDGSDGPAFLVRWDVASGGRSVTPLRSDGVLATAFVANGRRLLVVTDHQIITWSTHPFRRVGVQPQPVALTKPVPPTVGISPDGRTLGYGTSLGSVLFLDLRSARLTPASGSQNGVVQQAVFSPDGSTMVTSGDDGRVIVWDPSTARAIETLTGHGGRVTGAAFTRDSRTLFTTSLDGVVFEWDLGSTRRFGTPFSTTSGPLPALDNDGNEPPPLAISPDGSRFAAVAGPSTVGIYSTATARRVARIAAGGDVAGLAWSRQDTLAVAGPNGFVRLWDVRARPRRGRSLQGLRSFNGQPEIVRRAAFSPDGRLFAAGDVNHTPNSVPYRFGTAAVWDTATAKLLWRVRTKQGAVTSLAVSPDGRTLAVSREDGTVTLYALESGTRGTTVRPQAGGNLTYETAAFAPDGTLATGTWGGIVQRWNAHTGAEIGRATLVAAAPVGSIAFAPGGKVFATAGGSDGLAKLWTTSTLQQFGATFPGDPGAWGNAQYTPDGSKLVVVYDDGHGFVWPVSLDAWERHACAVAARDLTREEWARYISGRAYSAVCSTG